MKRKTKESFLLGLGIITLTYILEFQLLPSAQVLPVPEEQKPSTLIIIYDSNMTEIHWATLPVVENLTIPDPQIHTFPDFP